jgi:molybdenum cofactor biosynthesis enzyme MoaA
VVDESIQLADCRTLDEFYQRSLALGLHESPRFMHLELDLINRCNLRCVMCYHSQDHARHARTAHMTPEAFATIAGCLLPSCYRLSLSLGNEPLMSPHFTDILRIAAPYAVPNVNFFTNAQLLDAGKIEAILDCGVTQVCVSVDGATARTYNGIRRDGDFDRLLSNVPALIAARAARAGSRLRVRFDMVMMQRNVHEMADLVRLAARLGVDELDFVHVVAFEGLDMERESLRHTMALSNYCRSPPGILPRARRSMPAGCSSHRRRQDRRLVWHATPGARCGGPAAPRSVARLSHPRSHRPEHIRR